jgi:hypothetical protein
VWFRAQALIASATSTCYLKRGFIAVPLARCPPICQAQARGRIMPRLNTTVILPRFLISPKPRLTGAEINLPQVTFAKRRDMTGDETLSGRLQTAARDRLCHFDISSRLLANRLTSFKGCVKISNLNGMPICFQIAPGTCSTQHSCATSNSKSRLSA